MISEHALYDNIDNLPIKRWFKILATGDLKYLYVGQNGPVNKRLSDMWLAIEQQYYDEFGVDVEFQIRIEWTKEKILLECEYVITEDRKLLSQIAILENELSDQGEEFTVKMYDTKDKIEQIRGYQIDLDKTTVIEWVYMVKNVPKQTEQKGVIDG